MQVRIKNAVIHSLACLQNEIGLSCCFKKPNRPHCCHFYRMMIRGMSLVNPKMVKCDALSTVQINERGHRVPDSARKVQKYDHTFSECVCVWLLLD